MDPISEDRFVALLKAERANLIHTMVARAQATMPAYAAAPAPLLAERFALTLDSVIASFGERNPSLLTRYLEEMIHQRMADGYTIEALIKASYLVEQAIRELVQREFAASPDLLAASLRRIDRLSTTGRDVVGRINLARMMDPPPTEEGS